MTDFKISPHFMASELFSEDMLNRWGMNCLWWLDPRIPIYLELIRSRFGVTYLNNWKWGGNADSRGYRSPSDPDGSFMSQHRSGRAVDMVFKDFTADEVRADIKQHWKELYLPLGITCIESEVSWVHSDMRYIPNQSELMIVKP